MSKIKLKAAKEFLIEKKYNEARIILESLGNDPIAKEWLSQLDKNKSSSTYDKHETISNKTWEYGELFWEIQDPDTRQFYYMDATQDYIESGRKLPDYPPELTDTNGYVFTLYFHIIDNLYTQRENLFQYFERNKLWEDDIGIKEAQKLPQKQYLEYRYMRLDGCIENLARETRKQLHMQGGKGWELIQITNSYLPNKGGFHSAFTNRNATEEDIYLKTYASFLLGTYIFKRPKKTG